MKNLRLTELNQNRTTNSTETYFFPEHELQHKFFCYVPVGYITFLI